MGQWRPVSNLRDQVSRRPPVVVFFLSLLVISITFVCTGLYSQNHDIKNPDISVQDSFPLKAYGGVRQLSDFIKNILICVQKMNEALTGNNMRDWNGVLASFAGFQFCTHVNDTDAALEEDSPRMVEHADATNISMSTSHVSLLVPLVFIGDVPYDTVISATMLGSQLGIKGAAAKASVNISLLLHTDVPNNQTPAGTKTSGPLSCLHFTALTHVLPHTPSPPECPVVENVDKDASPVRTVAVESNKHSSPHCFSLEFKSDPHLTVLLTKDEKALCRYHLLLVSVALLVICILMSLCGSFSSRSPRSYQGNNLLKESLLSP